jgi:hypothetical protein
MRTLVIIPAEFQEQANTLFVQDVDGAGGDRTFSESQALVPANGADDATPTHYWCSVNLTADAAAKIAEALPEFLSAAALPYQLTDRDFPLAELDRRNLKPRSEA